MRNLFDGFEEKIADMHCLLCEGKEPYEVWNIETKRFEYVTGYIQHEGEPVSLLRTIAKEEAGIQHEVQRPANPHAKQL